MKLIDLINSMYKNKVPIGLRFTLRLKEFTLNTYEIRECDYGLMIWDLDNDGRFDSEEYLLDYLDYEVEIIEEKPKKIKRLEKRCECVRNGLFPTGFGREYYDKEDIIVKIEELRKATNYLLEKSDSE